VSVGFLAIRNIEPDRGRSGSARAKHGTLQLYESGSTRWSVPPGNLVLRSALHRRIYIRSTGARHGHHSHEEGNTRLDAVSR
jgi:hypothetical protein